VSNPSEIRIVLGSLRYKSNTDKSVWIQPPLMSDIRQYVEGDRTILVDQQVIFDKERQTSDTFRIAGKITNIVDNVVSGKTTYTPFRDFLFYTNSVQNAINSLTNPSTPWEGYPQFDEFVISRSQGIPNHIPFINKSASSYNWAFYLTYPYSSTTTQRMSYTNETYNVTNNNFLCGDGIPYVIDSGSFNGKQLVYFYCGANHNLSENEYVELSTPINGRYVFPVYSLGDGTYGSEEKVFSIYNLKFNDSEIQTGTNGTLKRISNISNSAETKSKYYIRLHKILKTSEDCNIAKAGYENNPFFIKRQTEYDQLTPNQTERISTKNGSQTFSITFDTDLHISGLMDNNGKPITELYLTLVERGYMGWFNKPNLNDNNISTGLEVGWEFNLLNNTIDNWWNKTSPDNKDNIPSGSYNANGQTFYYNEFLNIGDTLKGDFCEYNEYEQKEYVLSKMLHKYSFNDLIFYNNNTSTLPSGYLYSPHNPIKIRVFSDYLESGSKDNVDNIPGYAWYSQYDDIWYWRDLYTYGYIDNDNNGVDYPFLNGAHYPFKNLTFLQYPEKKNYTQITIINDLTNDDCE